MKIAKIKDVMGDEDSKEGKVRNGRIVSKFGIGPLYESEEKWSNGTQRIIRQ